MKIPRPFVQYITRDIVVYISTLTTRKKREGKGEEERGRRGRKERGKKREGEREE